MQCVIGFADLAHLNRIGLQFTNGRCCGAPGRHGHTLAGQILGAVDAAGNLLDSQRGRQLRGIKRDENHTREHPENRDKAGQGMFGSRFGLRDQCSCGPIECEENPRKIFLRRHDPFGMTPLEEPDDMRRDQDQKRADAQPGQRRPGHEQAQHVQQGVPARRDLAQRHDLEARVEDRL